MQHSDIVDDENFENDDLVTFHHDSRTINLFYSQLTKYSKLIRETYLFSDVVNRLPQEIQQFQEEFQLLPDSVDYFFQLSQQNYNINEDLILTYIQCVDLLKISKFLEVRKLSSKINQYIKTHNIDVDFIIQMLQYDFKTQTRTNNQQMRISKEIEGILTNKINECLLNEKFKELPIEIIYRIIEKSSPDMINNNKLFDIIIKSLSKFCVLFPFLELQKLSDDRLSELCEMYSKSNENTRHFFNYLKCNLNLIKEMNDRKKNLEEMNDGQRNKMNDLEEKITSLQDQLNNSKELNDKQQNKMNDLEALLQKQLNEQQNKMNDLETLLQKKLNDAEKANDQLQNQLNDSKKLNNEQQSKMNDLETLLQKQLNEQQSKMNDLETLLQKKLNDAEKANDQFQNQLNDSKKLNNEQQSKMNDLETLLQKKLNDAEKANDQLQNQVNYSKELENQVSQLQNRLNKLLIIKGQIVASVEKGLLINAEINLISLTLDTTKSKVIISTSDAKYLGNEAYEKGEPITSLHMNTTFFSKPGQYYVRCIVFNSNGESNEIVSNSVTTSGSSLKFDYEGRKASKIPLPEGQYKLEVWGAKGGDSTGNGYCDRGNSIVLGGLGGYSCGILSLNKKETVYVYVGEKGRPSNSSEGSCTEGGFPDGGGARTGSRCHYSCTTVPGTGGGSTSIRIGKDTNYSRVIVAGGGGGASGSEVSIDPGGFGGGLNGGNCYYSGSLKDQGAGTQTGSTRGLGQDDNGHGDPGVFGSGATSKYHQGRNSGGGGGGGWYGGGSGGFGHNQRCSSGGGGSGWTFTETSLQTFQSGDASNASKFELNSSYYLTDTLCVGGNEEFPIPDGNGNERGHADNGYAKITPL